MIDKELKCRYKGHNDTEVGFERPDGKIFLVQLPEEVKSGNVDFLKWIKPVESFLTQYYCYKKNIDEKRNIKRDLTIRINRFWFYYDLNDGVAEIYDVCGGTSNTSIYEDLISLFDFENTKTINTILQNISEQNKVEVKEFVLLPWKWNDNTIYVDEQIREEYFNYRRVLLEKQMSMHFMDYFKCEQHDN